MGPLFLTLTEVIDIHNDQIKRYGGDTGARDLGLLESAISVPQSGFGGQLLHASLFEMAAAYAFTMRREGRISEAEILAFLPPALAEVTQPPK